jgi:hypothetical protein
VTDKGTFSPEHEMTTHYIYSHDEERMTFYLDSIMLHLVMYMHRDEFPFILLKSSLSTVKTLPGTV